jgi:1-acyl-sn-glycerol-3-phosphate acyltransferase
VQLPEWAGPLWYEFCYVPTMACMTLGFSYRSEGRLAIPRSGPALLLANHQSYLDPPLVGLATRRHLRYLARKTLFRHRLLASLMLSLGAVPIDQEGVAKEGLRTIIDLLQQGQAVLVFPEGERTFTGAMQPFRPGIHLLLRRVPVPVVPVGIAGAYQALSRHRTFPRLSPLFCPATNAAIAVSVGKPLPGPYFAELPREQALRELFEAVQAAQQRAEKLRRKV